MRARGPADPELVGPYRVLAELGRGGMGRVWLASAPDGSLVAVKQVREQFADDTGFRSRFRREVDASRRVAGPYTASVVDADPEAPTPWLASEFVAGPSLQEALRVVGPLPEASVLTLARTLAAALGEVHGAGLVHRDLKPSNVLLTDAGLRVIDFGIARATDSEGGTQVTHTGWLVGAAGFMSPEQAEGRPVTGKSDVFSLGTVLIVACTGANPFDGASAPQTLFNVVYSQPNLDELPDRIREIVAQCLAKDPDDRPTPEQLLATVGPASEPEPEQSWPASAHRLIAKLLAAAGPALAAGRVWPASVHRQIAAQRAEAVRLGGAANSSYQTRVDPLRDRVPPVNNTPTAVVPEPTQDNKDKVRPDKEGKDKPERVRSDRRPRTVRPVRTLMDSIGEFLSAVGPGVLVILCLIGAGAAVESYQQHHNHHASASNSPGHSATPTAMPSAGDSTDWAYGDYPEDEDTYSPSPEPTAREPYTLDDESTDETPQETDQFFPYSVDDYERAAADSGKFSSCRDAGGDATDELMDGHGCGSMLTASYLDNDNGLMASVMAIPLSSSSDADVVYSELHNYGEAFHQLGRICPQDGTGADLCDYGSQPADTWVFYNQYHRYVLIAKIIRLDGGDTAKTSAGRDLGHSVLNAIQDRMLEIR